MVLTKLQQIDGGEKLRSDVDSLLNKPEAITSENLLKNIRIDGTATDEHPVSEKAIADVINNIATNQIYDKIEVPETATQENPLSTFTIAMKPNDSMVRLIIDHLIYLEGMDFSINRDTKTVTWTNTAANGGFDITNTDFQDIVAVYESSENK